MSSRPPGASPSPQRRSKPARLWLGGLAAALSLSHALAADEADFAGAEAVNEGQLHFLAEPPAKPVHHHRNRIQIRPSSLDTGWVTLSQCHDHLDAVPRAEITFREGHVRDLRVVASDAIGDAWVEGASVQLRDIAPGARLCLSADTRALKPAGSGYFGLASGPYMRKFLDGYYPLRVTLDVDYPAAALRLLDVSPPPQTGFTLTERAGSLRLEALFEGELNVRIRFERP